jgi:hypothetical protein
MNKLTLPLKTKWFEMTKAGIKTEDYRELTPFWKSRLTDQKKNWARPIEQWKFKKFDLNIMTLGYPKSTDTERVLKFEHAGIEIRTGNPEWGAEPGKLYFVIKHGKQIQL